jgi:hypothetical protein
LAAANTNPATPMPAAVWPEADGPTVLAVESDVDVPSTADWVGAFLALVAVIREEYPTGTLKELAQSFTGIMESEPVTGEQIAHLRIVVGFLGPELRHRFGGNPL